MPEEKISSNSGHVECQSYWDSRHMVRSCVTPFFAFFAVEWGNKVCVSVNALLEVVHIPISGGLM
jgi:hypothetical protein